MMICFDRDDDNNSIPSAGIPARISLNLGETESTFHRHRFSIVLDGYAGLVFDKRGFVIQRAPIHKASEMNMLNYQVGLGLGYQMM
jgi:hypothetical protein